MTDKSQVSSIIRKRKRKNPKEGQKFSRKMRRGDDSSKINPFEVKLNSV